MRLIKYTHDVNSAVNKRAYASPVRQARAEATRQRVLDAATALFLEHGYARTSTAAIGQAAGVSEASVFAAWKTKGELLVAVVAHSVGSDPDFPLRTNPSWERHVARRDSASALRDFARVTRRAHERSWRLLEIVGAAAHDDPNVAAAATSAAQRRHDDCAWFVGEVLGVSGRSAARVVDAVWALISVENYRRLVVERAWPSREYETWLTAVLQASLD